VLIIEFGASFGDTVATLRQQIAEGRFEEAAWLTHTLRGTAASLEAGGVAEAAMRLEDALGGREPGDPDVLLRRLDDALRPAIAAARSLSAALGREAVAPLP
jgi:two-component system sensor histidine kinase/response regulator